MLKLASGRLPCRISDATYDARTPVVAFVGPDSTPLVAWVENMLTYEQAQALPAGNLSLNTREQEIFYSLWNGEIWASRSD